MRISVASLFLSAAFLFLNGCTAVGPNYKSVDPVVPVNYGSLEPGIATPDPINPEQLKTWWKIFRDPVLDALMEQAVKGNLDLRIARASVREARALRGEAFSKYLPEGGVSGTYDRLRRNDSGFSGGVGGGGLSGDREIDYYQAGFDASWEVDIFGGVRREVEAADANLGAAQAALGDTLISLQGEVGRNYIELRALQLRLDIAHEDVNERRENVALTESKFKAGLISELDLARIKGALANAESSSPFLDNALRAVMHRLGVLCGQEPTHLIKELEVASDLPKVPENLPTGLPSDLLRRRPDIRQAERELAAATARIGVSTAELFPRFSLTGAFGYQSIRLADLADSGSSFWRIGPTFQWNILNFKRILSGIEAGEAVRDGRLAEYEKKVLIALEEVENALVTLSREKRRTDVLGQAVQSNTLATDLATKRFEAGLESYLAVIDAQAALRISQDQLAQSKESTALGLVSLYKALGGGWDMER